MLLGFKRRFAPMILDGSKRHTIRGKGRNWRPGIICDCYVDPRQKTMRLLGRWPCVRVEKIQISDSFLLVDGRELSTDEKELLAWHDGFRRSGADSIQTYRSCFDEMMAFWIG